MHSGKMKGNDFMFPSVYSCCALVQDFLPRWFGPSLAAVRNGAEPEACFF